MSSAPAAGELAQLIGGLGSEDNSIRESAGAELFRRGREMARAATEKWIGDADFARSCVPDASGLPETTVGIAVTPETFDRIRAAHGFPRLSDVPPDQDAKEFELHLSQGVRLDILTTRDPTAAGAIARYIAKFGEGIQQVEFLVRDVDRASEVLRSRFGVQPIYPATRPGADGTRVNFFLAASANGTKVLIELVEPRAANPR
jgi:methylmalonyl-CoA/ethylmalonyl-CoA epimerase